MGQRVRSACAAAAVVLTAFLGLALTAPSATAASRVWTTDADWNESGASFTGTEVVGVGVAARIDLRKDVTDWANRTPPLSPNPREGPAVAFSSSTNVTVLFGGFDGTYLDDTWEYSFATNTWTWIGTDPHPPGRAYAGMSYDSVERVMVLFGGSNSSDPDVWLTDTWEYDVQTRTWSQTGARGTGPKMLDTPLAYDAAAARHILFGQNATNGVMQTWAYDAAADTWTNRNPSGSPGVRASHALAYHAARDRTVLFGGMNPFPPPGTLLDETWEYSYAGNSWSQIGGAAPSPRASPAMAHRPASSALVLFGGQSDTGTLQDTWRYTESAVWEPVATGTAPPDRKAAGFAYDAPNDGGILFGGVTAGGVRRGDTWTLGASYRVAGRYASAVFDSGASTTDWQTLWWNASTPPNTYVRLQLATANAPAGPWNFVGPDGTPSTYYMTSGTAVWSGHDGQRYFRFLADFGNAGTDTQVTPSLEDVSIDFTVPVSPPYIVSEDPACPSFGVSQTKVPRVVFSEPMDTASVFVNFSTGTPVTWTYVWTGDSTLDLQHAQPFAEDEVYRLLIEGRDKQGEALAPTSTPNVCDGTPSEPWMFTTEAVNPTIVATSPVQGDADVNLSAPIVITFSEPMDTATVNWTISPPIALTPAWSGGDTVLTLTHAAPFLQCAVHTVNVTGRDRANLALAPGPTPNPWSFTTECVNPYLVQTNPFDLQGDVATNADVLVQFSKPMDPGSVRWELLRGPPTTFVPTWSNGNRNLTLSHAQPFPGCAVYEMRITGNGSDGRPLVAGPPNAAPNPWTWVTACDNPYIVITRPADGEANVSLTQDILILFSEEMDTASASWTITPSLAASTQWGAGVQLLIQHEPFRECTRYTVHVTAGRNLAGLGLVPGPAPNPFSFNTICESPYLVSTDPANDTALVPVTAPIVVRFSEPMDAASVLVSITPSTTLDRQWSDGNRTLTLTHPADFLPCTEYEVFVDGVGADGRNLLIPGPAAPDPWRFTTRCPGLYLLRTDPADLEQDVPLNASIVIEFSEPVDTATFQVTLSPGVPLTRAWSAGDTIVALSHGTPFPECRSHSVTVSARNQTGGDLRNVTGSKRNPWTFRTACVPPQIVSTDPADGATDVPLGAPIVVTFSEPMLRTSVTWAILPAISVSPGWSDGDRTLTLNHSTPFQSNVRYQVAIAGTDVDGVPLAPGAVPNPWRFTTSPAPAAPGGLQVIRVIPDDILLTWRPVTGAVDYVVYSAVDRFAPWPWPQIAVVTTTAYTAAGHLTDGLAHYYIVRARDRAGNLSANSTMGVKVSLSFSYSNVRSNVYWLSLPYRTMYRRASDIAGELTSARVDVIGKWNPATQSPVLYYWFRGAWRGTNFAIDPGDGIYIGVRASFPWFVNGTDGPVPLSFAPNPPPSPNLHWISLPYGAAYARASDLVRDIEGSTGPGANTKILEVARWDAAAQQLVTYSWTPGGWSGTDFAIASGEGVYLRIVAGFTWIPRLLTPEEP